MEGILIIITHPASQLTICLQTVRCQCCQRCGSFRTSWSREWPQLCLRSLCSITRYVYCKYYCHFYCLLFYLRFCVLCFNTVGWETGKASNTRFYGPDAFPVKKLSVGVWMVVIWLRFVCITLPVVTITTASIISAVAKSWTVLRSGIGLTGVLESGH